MQRPTRPRLGFSIKLKSTIVRFILSIVQRSIRVLCKVMPGPAASLAGWLFLRPLRRSRRRSEQRLLAEGRGFELRVRSRAGREQQLHAWSWGQGPTVLLVHGWAGDAAQLAPLAQRLARNGFRAVAFDAPGHGQSEGRSSSLPAMADAVLELGRRLGPLHGVVAHSLGTAATSAALSWGLVAQRVIYLAPPADIPGMAQQHMAKLGFSKRVLETMQRQLEKRFGVLFEQMSNDYLAPRQRLPLLLVHDRRDREVPCSEGERLAQLWPGAQLQLSEGLGHVRLLLSKDVHEKALRFLGAEPMDADQPREEAANVPAILPAGIEQAAGA